MSNSNNSKTEAIVCEIPVCWSKTDKIEKNVINQILIGAGEGKLKEITGHLWAIRGHKKWRILNHDEDFSGSTPVLRLATAAQNASEVCLEGAQWLGALAMNSPIVVRNSLEGAFRYIEENSAKARKGLRTPQIGAVHAVKGYWTLPQHLPATVVMPTGTGKTETMLSLFAAEAPELLLVLVPSNALREQLSRKFETYGILQKFGVLDAESLHPAVGRIAHGFVTAAAAKEFARKCNIIVTTPNALSHSTPEAKAALLNKCTHLFVDEAHHITAPTWRAIRDNFAGKPVVQFTATPFREDGAELGGKLAYTFLLRQAQEQGYFSKINYSAVIDFEDLDGAIAAKAVEQLKADLDAGFDHILMARVQRISRASDILPLYQALAPELHPVILHSAMKPQILQQEAIAAVRSGESKIIICVDMLGEGFDLPNLKVAAIHEPHKSLGITLQFVGRFARVSDPSIGEASVIVGRTEANYDENLKKLYSEDPDWNLILSNLSASAIGEQEEISEFEEGFRVLPEEISLRNIAPKMSTVVYKTECDDWRPEALEGFFQKRLFTHPVAINETDHVAWLVTKEVMSVRWGDIKTVEEILYDLYAFHWDPDTQLLYVNGSNNDSLHEDLAEVLCGKSATRIKGKVVYRTMASIKRRVPTNVGLLDSRNRKRSFAMHSGSNVTEAFPTAEAQTKTQTNIFAYGFESGSRISMGISLKGRIWSHAVAPTLKHWVNWCKSIGAKLINETINIDEVVAGFIRPEEVEDRPRLVALALEWPWEIYASLTEDLRLAYNGVAFPLVDVDLKINAFSNHGSILFQVVTPQWSVDYSLTIGVGKLLFAPVDADKEASILTSRKSLPLTEYLNTQGLKVIMEGEAVIEPQAILIRPNRDLPPFDVAGLTPLDWTGIDIHKESQGRNRDQTSVQARVIQHMRSLANWDLIIDDDGAGETADIVAARIEGNKMIVMLTHCKYSSEDNPGARVGDLYEVCGQAQKSVEWRRKPDLMFRHLIRRERKRRRDHRYSGLIVGTEQKLLELAERAQYSIHEWVIAIAQPGLAKSLVSLSQLNLLASTEVYVRETSDSALIIYTSD